MRPSIPRRAAYWALVLFLAIDLLGAVALAYSLLFKVESPQLWIISAVLVVIVLPLLLRAADAIFAMAQDAHIVPMAGGKIP